MHSRTLFRVSAVALSSLLGVFACDHASALTMTWGGYTVTPFMTVTNFAEGMVVGPDGTLYLLRQSGGISRISPDGIESPWSAAMVADLTIGPSGNGFATEWGSGALLRIESSGSSSTFVQDSIRWGSVALAPSGALYASGTWDALTGTGGVFQIDPSTGNRTLVVAFDNSHSYGDLEFGLDGRLYAKESVWQGSYENRLARLDGTQFTTLGVFPHPGFGLSAGPNGVFWLMGGFDYGSGYPLPEIWQMDAATGASNRFAYSWVDHNFWGIGYDRVRSRIYIGDPPLRLVQPDPVIYALTEPPTPVRNVSWGRIKALYR